MGAKSFEAIFGPGAGFAGFMALPSASTAQWNFLHQLLHLAVCTPTGSAGTSTHPLRQVG